MYESVSSFVKKIPIKLMFYNFFDPKRKKQGSKNFPLWTVLRETLVKNEAGNAQLLTGLRKTPFPRCFLAF